MNIKNPELNAKLEELSKVLEDMGFEEFTIEIRQHRCAEEQAKRLGESVSDSIECKSYHGEDDPIHWLEAELRHYPNDVRLYCFYELDKEVSAQ